MTVLRERERKVKTEKKMWQNYMYTIQKKKDDVRKKNSNNTTQEFATTYIFN